MPNPTVEELVYNPSFQQWKLQGIDNDHWQEWVSMEPERFRLVQEAYVVLLAMNIPKSNIAEEDIDNALASTLQKIEDRNIGRIPFFASNLWFFRIAGMIIFLVGLGWFVIEKNERQSLTNHQETAQDIKILENNTNYTKLIMLEDGSSVLLQPGSQLRYPSKFERNQRQVSLIGEAFFEISKNPHRPFFVYAKETITRVVGTSFRISAYLNQPDVEIVVKTGKVNVSHKPNGDNSTKHKEITLLPNESARFVERDQSFEKSAEPVSQESKKFEQYEFNFSDTPVTQILDIIAEAYSLKIDYPKNVLSECYVSTALTDEPLPEKLKIICEILGKGTTYDLNGQELKIITKGCN